MSLDISVGKLPIFSVPPLHQAEETDDLQKEVEEALEAEAESLPTERRQQFLAGMRQHAGDILKFLDLMEREGAFPFKIMETARVLFAELKEIGADFNLRPETQSLQMLKQEMIDLIELYQVPSTRSSLYPKLQEQPFADYVLTCPKIAVKHFEVLKDEVSDHSPLLLEFT